MHRQHTIILITDERGRLLVRQPLFLWFSMSPRVDNNLNNFWFDGVFGVVVVKSHDIHLVLLTLFKCGDVEVLCVMDKEVLQRQLLRR